MRKSLDPTNIWANLPISFLSLDTGKGKCEENKTKLVRYLPILILILFLFLFLFSTISSSQFIQSLVGQRRVHGSRRENFSSHICCTIILSVCILASGLSYIIHRQSITPLSTFYPSIHKFLPENEWEPIEQRRKYFRPMD